MYCVKNGIFCYDCNRSYIDSNYSNNLRSQRHIDNVMKKDCCSCLSKIFLKSDVGVQTDFSEKQDYDILIENFKSFWNRRIKTENDFDEIEMILDEFLRVKAITIKQYNNVRKKCDFEKRHQLL